MNKTRNFKYRRHKNTTECHRHTYYILAAVWYISDIEKKSQHLFHTWFCSTHLCFIYFLSIKSYDSYLWVCFYQLNRNNFPLNHITEKNSKTSKVHIVAFLPPYSLHPRFRWSIPFSPPPSDCWTLRDLLLEPAPPSSSSCLCCGTNSDTARLRKQLVSRGWPLRPLLKEKKKHSEHEKVNKRKRQAGRYLPPMTAESEPDGASVVTTEGRTELWTQRLLGTDDQ